MSTIQPGQRNTAARPSRAPERRVELAAAGAADSRMLERARAWALILLLAWAPLPFGSDRPWAASVLGIAATLLLLASGVREAAAPTAGLSLRPLRFPIAALVALSLWALFQCLPWSGFGWHHPLWDMAADALGGPVVPSLSIARGESLGHLFRLLGNAAVFLVAWQVGQRAEGAALVMRAILVIGTAYAVYGLVEYASPHPSILWFPKRYYVDDLTSTFVNRNSFATFVGLAIVASLMLIAETLIRHTDARSRTTLALSTIESLLWRGKWPVLAFAVMSSALLLTHSRGGAAATALGCAVFLATVAIAPSLRAEWRRSFGWFLLIGLATAFTVSGFGVIQRVLETPLGGDARGVIYSATLAAIRDNFFFGTGLGTFKYVFPMYQPATFQGAIDLAHNEYLESMLELGVPAAMLLFAAIGFLAVQCLLGVVRRRKDALYSCAAVAASALVAAHSLVDFSLQMPAVAVSYAAILGVGTAQAISSRRAGGRSP